MSRSYCRGIVISLLCVLLTGAVSRADVVAYWSFDKKDGTTPEVARDLSGNGNNGKIHGAASVPGIVGEALQFNGKDNYVDCGNKSSLDKKDAITVEAWVKFTKAVKYPGRYVVGRKGIIELNISRQGRARFGLALEGGRWTHPPVSNSNLNDGQWHHLVGTYDRKKLRFFVDGTEQGKGTPATTPIMSSPATIVEIGSYAKSSRFFEGLIDEVRIHNAALSPIEISRLYDKASDTAAQNLLENGDFEKSAEVEGWKVFRGYPGELSIVSAPKFKPVAGKNCLLVVPTLRPRARDNKYRAILRSSVRIPAADGDTFEYTFWAKGSGPLVDVVMYRSDKNGKDMGGQWFRGLRKVTEEWTKVAGTAVVKDASEKAAAEQKFKKRGIDRKVSSVTFTFDIRGEGYVYIDDVRCRAKTK